MANKEHLEILKQGVKAWNAWRIENPEIAPDLIGFSCRGYGRQLPDELPQTPYPQVPSGREGRFSSEQGWFGENLEGVNFEGVDLFKCRLEGFRLKDANFQRANLEKANFRGTDLQNADFRGANLKGAHFGELADLGGANLDGVSLRGTDLQDADLSEAKGLRAKKLGGANVNGAKLPPDITKFQALKQVEELSKHAQKTFLAMIVGCFGLGLTIITPPTNPDTITLPIIGTPVPSAYFFPLASLLLIAMYSYLLLYLQQLWEALAGLPAIFQDGRRLDEMAYPWLPTRIVLLQYIKRLEEHRPALWSPQSLLAKFLIWQLVPITVFGAFMVTKTKNPWPDWS